jgi:ABC-2 type transport system permease protein
MCPVRSYLALFSARFRMMLQYRAAAIAGLWTQVFFGMVLIMIYEAFYSSTSRPQPMPFSQIVSYVWLGQAMLGMLPWNADPEVRAMIRSGAVAYELCRPLDLYNLWFMRALAGRSAPTILRAVPMAILAIFALPLVGLGSWRLRPPTLVGGLAFAATIVCALLLSSALSTLINITLMWTVSADGMVVMLTALVTLLSGMTVPLPLFPDWAQPVLRALPFAGLVDLPYRVYLGDIAPSGLPGVMLRQLLWTAALALFGRWLLARGLRRIVVQGG